jgi:5-methylthioadenosine/S-adenosylhomocysteine deaminase
MVELSAAGARVSVASDGAAPYRSLDLWRDLASAVWAAWRHHRDQAVLAPMQALRAVTSDAAMALGLGDEIGSLEAGKRADVIAVDLRSPHLLPIGSTAYQLVHGATGADVAHVIANGVVLMRDRAPTRLDPEAIRSRALDEARLAFERHGPDAVARYRWR